MKDQKGHKIPQKSHKQSKVEPFSVANIFLFDLDGIFLMNSRQQEKQNKEASFRTFDHT